MAIGSWPGRILAPTGRSSLSFPGNFNGEGMNCVVGVC
jgi:hypothetical protein